MSRRVKIALGAAIALIALWTLAGYYAASIALGPRQRAFEDREQIGGKTVENVSIKTEDGLTLSAWFVRNGADKAVITLAGIGSDRRACVGQAENYLNLGYSVLMPDLRATGKSEGRLVSIGWYERKDLEACFEYLRGLDYRHIGADGISLGAATICYSLKELDGLAFIVLESSYTTMKSAIENRLKLYHIPRFLAYPMEWFGEWKLGVPISEMRPLFCLDHCKAPALILGGDSERVLNVAETMLMYGRCKSPIKRLYIFKGAHHENFTRRYASEYRQVLGDFLAEVSATWTTP